MSEIGLIFHWGLYSVPAYHELSVKPKAGNGSEWYKKRLLETSDYRPIGGHKNTKAYHEANYQGQTYDDFAKSFATIDCSFQFDNWMLLAKSVGATYVILTAKHHDGYCLWPTLTANPHHQTDLIAQFKVSALKHQLKFGLYYSWMEFDHTFTQSYLKSVITPQIAELIQYNPDIFWFDGDWSCKTQVAKQTLSNLVLQIKTAIPKIELNDRIGQVLKSDELGLATYRNYGDREMPLSQPKVPWESIQTISYSWGRNRAQTLDQYKTGTQLYSIYNQTKRLNGRLLLNLGPNADGTLDPLEIQSLRDFANEMALAKSNHSKIKIGLKPKIT